jgi:hypothetical protein
VRLRAIATSGAVNSTIEVRAPGILGPDGDTICGPRPVGNGYFSCHVGYGGYAYTILVSDQSGTGIGDYDMDVYW